MITPELKSLITQACALPNCPEGVRAALAHYLSTGQITHAQDILFGPNGSLFADQWWLFYTSVTDAAAALFLGDPGVYEYWMEDAEHYFNEYCKSQK